VTPPPATYRLQIRPGFTLDDAREVIDYLAELGVGAVYLSPVLTSTEGSDHGYDVTDPTRIDPQRGGEDGFERLLTTAAAAGLPVVVDIVPNHLGVEAPEQNPAWWDVLTFGRDSVYADWFDIDWSAPKLLLPVLGDDPAEVDRLRVEDGRLRYWEHSFPIAPGTEGGTAAEVHERQHYQLVSYRKAQTELGYRRFFAVATLAGIRVEDPGVFDATHTRIRRMVEQGVTGLRVDHPDGLADPGGYLDRLRALAPDAWITVEKILEPGEELPDWPVAGTTGYDALVHFGGVFIDPAAEDAMTAVYRRHTGDENDAAGHIRVGKRLVLDTLFGSELRRIGRLADGLPQTPEVVAEAATRYPVYRSYLPEGADRTEAVLDDVAAARPELASTVRALRPRLLDAADELAVRFQQLTGAVMAKGVEDTAFYRYNRLTALNEVGGDPDRFGVGVEDFHAAQQHRLDRWPAAMTTLSTHDTKRSEDVRAWLAVLAEVPERWDAFCAELSAAVPMPEPTLAYLLWQTVAAVGLIDRDRLQAYAEKAMKEAALRTGWLDADPAFEEAVHQGLDRLYDDPALGRLVEEFRADIRTAATANLLGQKLLQLTAPGVPDVYQGTEYVDDSLVDPDNRRPVDFAARRRRLAELDRSGAPDPGDVDAVKLWLVSRALRARRDLESDGYRPLYAAGPAAEHLVGFDRGPLVAVATRLPYGLAAAGGWRDTELTLPDGDWTDRLTGAVHTGTVPVARLLERYPMALLVR
jgi:(1->4)-alpha-D-glucan 1-alpha-D-glucosylmutase